MTLRKVNRLAKYKEEINEYKDELISESYDEELEKQLDVLYYELSVLNKELKRIENVIKKNDSFRKYIESMKIRVRASSGEEIPVNKDTIVDMNEYIEMLETKRRIISSEINSIKKAIEKLRIEMPQDDAQLSFGKKDSILTDFDKNMVKFDIDAIAISKAIDRLEKELKNTRGLITEATKRDNHIVDEMSEIIMRYSQELGVDLVNRANYLFTKNLKELSGAVLHKLVFVYRLAAVLSIEKYLGYKLPLLIDSPSGKEVDRENVNAMMKILARDFSKNQIIVASIYEYDFDDVNKVIINGKLIDQEVKTYK